MTWIAGIDEAGYGPNLGPFVMTCIACRVPDSCAETDLWHLLRSAVRRAGDADDGRLFLDDSKRVYTARGLIGLERGVLSILRRADGTVLAALPDLLAWGSPFDVENLRREAWFRDVQTLPIVAAFDDVETAAARFRRACDAAEVGTWYVRTVVVCPEHFNALLEEGGSKGHVLASALTSLLRELLAHLPDGDDAAIFIDKHGGRNTYAAMLQNALPHGIVVSERESLACSTYRLHGLGRAVRLTFQPRADGEHLCVALASMASKYLREVLMLEFNRFWRERVPNLKATAGYPVDAARFLRDIRTTMESLGLREECVWRRK
jgi:ribonuclease HII